MDNSISHDIVSKLQVVGSLMKNGISGLFSKVNTTDLVTANIDENNGSVDSEEFYPTTKISEPFSEYSDSDDSDEEIFTNYANMEKSNFDRRYSKRGSKDFEKIDANGTNISSSRKNSSSATSSVSKKPAKTAILRVTLSLVGSDREVSVGVVQAYDLIHSGAPAAVVSNIDSSSNSSLFQRQRSIMESHRPQTPNYQVHCTMLPEKKKKYKTKARPGPDPSFNEMFVFHSVTEGTAAEHSLRMRLYFNQGSMMYTIMGQAIIDLSCLDLSTESEYNFTMVEASEDDTISVETYLDEDGSSRRVSIVDPNDPNSKSPPELQLGLSHNSTTGRLTVEIVRGVNFSCLSSATTSNDFYAKLSLFYPNGKELSHTKTSVRKGSNSPVFRESFMFQVAQFQLNEVTLIVTVFAKKSIHRKELVGWIALGYKSSGNEEIQHWSDIKDEMESRQILRSHCLIQNSSAKKLLKN